MSPTKVCVQGNKIDKETNGSNKPRIINYHKNKYDKTPAQAFTPPADEKKMGTTWILVYYAVYGSGRGRCRNFLVLNVGGGGWS